MHVIQMAYSAGFEAYEIGLPLEDAWAAYLIDATESEDAEPVTKQEQAAYAKGWCDAWICPKVA